RCVLLLLVFAVCLHIICDAGTAVVQQSPSARAGPEFLGARCESSKCALFLLLKHMFKKKN
ncbi:hypothetical protein KJ032_27015, partial [Salmonella enterica subsp. enterica serovar Typhimurium]|nr:hypothetical protein [Salmonella enterica subsp. enterica serovar Typhimurium]